MRAFSTAYAAIAVLGFVASAACLRKDVTHSLYISPTAVTWSAAEKDVRSDETDPGNRLLEEQSYLLDARAGRQAIARALRSLGASSVDTTLLRRERPFTVVTDGRFADLAELALAMIRAARIRGDASIARDGCEKTFRAWVDVESASAEDDTSIDDLIADATAYRLILADGRFLRAEGFTIAEDGAIALPAIPAALEDGTVRVSLTWAEDWCAPRR